jgi:aminopeptidase
VIDERWRRVAEVLVRYSTGVRPGERVLIAMMEPHTLPLTHAVHAECVRAGAFVHVEYQSVDLDRDLMLLGTPEQVDWVPEMQTAGMKWADVYIGLRGASNLHVFEEIDPARIASRRRALGIVSASRTRETRWVLIRVPDATMAQQAGISTDEMMTLFFKAVLQDWETEAQRYRMIRRLFEGARDLRLLGRGTDVVFSTQGRTFEIEDGHLNMPGGELFTSPVEDSAEGVIAFEFPAVFAGQLVPGVRLEFARGRVVRASAEKNEEFLQSVLAMDDGARRIGEFGIGLNTRIERFFSDILYDEKIDGTVHIALGRSYAVCGGLNESALHWDIVKDTRIEGEIVVDGVTVFRDGKFLSDPEDDS